MSAIAPGPFVPAELVLPDGSIAPLCVHGLSCEDCIVSGAVPEGSHELWVGAIGPFHFARDPQRDDRLRFTGPIHPAIVRHFNSVLAMDKA